MTQEKQNDAFTPMDCLGAIKNSSLYGTIAKEIKKEFDNELNIIRTELERAQRYRDELENIVVSYWPVGRHKDDLSLARQALSDAPTIKPQKENKNV